MNEPFVCTIKNLDKFIIGEIYHIHHDTELGSTIDVYAVLLKINNYSESSKYLTFKCISAYEILSEDDDTSWEMLPGKDFSWWLPTTHYGPIITKVN
jgi:hypothetical protein